MKIKHPRAGDRRALFVIDAQPATLRSNEACECMKRIASYIRETDYCAYVVASFHAPAHSMFGRQLQWVLSQEKAGPTDPAILHEIAEKRRPLLEINKITRSVLKGDDAASVGALLDSHRIDEVHIVGFDINDCILATAYDALDKGYFTFVIEECANRTDADSATIDAALTVLRKQAMTNNSNILASIIIDV